ncbi:hypothetical protein P3339_17710 [Microbulbifer sp. MLAF003]|uniref:hypothetical protein n=1 Tax=Microbulbifer sp. MLAF003 TaxID=3032582 RepID=UPI0024AE04A5|nr:hypothetical protein [Microbulbifer sp. MLAF003]WHI50266.1 hypothetical protein P3339_17710 [Microbulbifer sp. MLAF003]
MIKVNPLSLIVNQTHIYEYIYSTTRQGGLDDLIHALLTADSLVNAYLIII